MSKQTVLTLLIILALLLIAAYVTYEIKKRSDYQNSEVAQTLGTDETAEYSTLSGEPVSLNTFDGQVRVVNSWASWSPFSKTELLALEALAANYQDRGVEVIAINRNENTARAERFLSQIGEFEHINFLMDGNDAFYARMDGKAMPETLFFDQQGNIVKHIRGELTYDKMVSYVEAALASE